MVLALLLYSVWKGVLAIHISAYLLFSYRCVFCKSTTLCVSFIVPCSWSYLCLDLMPNVWRLSVSLSCWSHFPLGLFGMNLRGKNTVCWGMRHDERTLL